MAHPLLLPRQYPAPGPTGSSPPGQTEQDAYQDDHGPGVWSGDDGGWIPSGPRLPPVPGAPCPSHRPAQEGLEPDLEPQSQAVAGEVELGLPDINDSCFCRLPVPDEDQRKGFWSARSGPDAVEHSLLARLVGGRFLVGGLTFEAAQPAVPIGRLGDHGDTRTEWPIQTKSELVPEPRGAGFARPFLPELGLLIRVGVAEAVEIGAAGKGIVEAGLHVEKTQRIIEKSKADGGGPGAQ